MDSSDKLEFWEQLYIGAVLHIEINTNSPLSKQLFTTPPDEVAESEIDQHRLATHVAVVDLRYPYTITISRKSMNVSIETSAETLSLHIGQLLGITTMRRPYLERTVSVSRSTWETLVSALKKRPIPTDDEMPKFDLSAIHVISVDRPHVVIIERYSGHRQFMSKRGSLTYWLTATADQPSPYDKLINKTKIFPPPGFAWEKIYPSLLPKFDIDTDAVTSTGILDASAETI